MRPEGRGWSLCADNTGRNGGLQAERRTNRNHPIAHLHAVGIADLNRSQRLLGVDFQYRQIRLFIESDYPARGIRFFAGQPDFDAVGLLDDVIVRDDVAILVDDEACSGALGAKGSLLTLALAKKVFATCQTGLRCAAFRVARILRAPSLSFRFAFACPGLAR